MPDHEWEDRPTEGLPNADNWGGECSDSDVDTATTPGMEFVKFVTKLLLTSTLPASTFCVIMFLAFKAGIAEAKPYGLKPNSPMGHYSRKVKGIMGWTNRASFYEMIVPGHGKHDLERRARVTQIIPAHEQWADDLSNLEAGEADLKDRLAREDGLPPCYYDHPVTQGAVDGEIVWPIAIYLDGVPYSHTDGVIGWWLINLITGKRYLPAINRKRNLCQCGCRGWCTFWQYFMSLIWTLRSLARGELPDQRHDKKPWMVSDHARSLRAGTAIPKAACLYIKGDWMEFATTLGFPMWMDSLRPCYDCSAFGDNMFETSGTTLETIRWHLNGDEDYFAACERCEHEVRLQGPNDIATLERFLRYDKRTDGSRGRALTRDVQIRGVELRVGDRLEPSESLNDVGALVSISEFPTTIMFWRKSDETLTRHRNPIFDREIGILPNRTLTVDVLHGFFLGVLNVWCRITIWKLVKHGCYGNLGNAVENINAATLVLRDSLMRFYSTYCKEHPHEDLTRVADLTLKMLGTADDPKIKTKGAETWGVFLFLISELRIRHSMVGAEAERLIHAGDMLEKIVRTWKAYDWIIPRSAAQENAHA